MAGKARARLVASAVLSTLVMPQPALAAAATHAAPEVVVTGTRSAPSGWRQAETSHIVMLSDGPESELVRLTRNLERLHFLISGLMGRGAVDDDTVKIRITLIGEAAQFDQLDLHNTRWQQGPYNDLFRVSRYYDPREDGAVMASIGADQRVVVEHTPLDANVVGELLTSLAQNGSLTAHSADPNAAENMRAEMAAVISGMAEQSGLQGRNDQTVGFGGKTITVSEESLLYAGYAQHFLLTYFPAAYPRWYLDGFGQIFASLVVKGDTALEFGRVPDGTTAVMHGFGPYPVRDVLDDAYLTQDPHKTGWTPVHAWMLTHFLFFSDKYRPLLRQYLAARAEGADADTAAKILGDQKVLAHELGSYFLNRKPYIEVTYDGTKIEQPIVRRLRQSEAAFVKGRLELGARVEIPPAPGAGEAADKAKEMTRKRADALQQRDKWLARLRRDAAHWPNELEAQLLLAEAECRSGNGNEGLAAAQRAERIAPADTRVLMWKGYAMVLQAAFAPAADRPAILAAARDLIVKANQIDHEAIGPLMAYYASFADAGEAPSTAALDGLQKAMEEVPAAPETRLTLATALAKRGQYDVARPVILPVAAGAYDTPEKPAAKDLLAQIDLPTHGQGQAAPDPAGPAKGSGARPAAASPAPGQ